MSSPGCYQDMLLTLSPFPRRFVDSWLYTVIVSILHALRSLTTSLSSSKPRAPICLGPSRFPPVSPPCICSSAVPSSSTPLHTPTSSSSSDRPPSSRVRRTTSTVLHVCCYDRLIGSESNFVAYLSDLVPPFVVPLLWKMKRIGSQQTISSFFKRPDTRR